MPDSDDAMTIYLRLLTERAEASLSAHAAAADGLDRMVREADQLRRAPTPATQNGRLRRIEAILDKAFPH